MVPADSPGSAILFAVDAGEHSGVLRGELYRGIWEQQVGMGLAAGFGPRAPRAYRLL